MAFIARSSVMITPLKWRSRRSSWWTGLDSEAGAPIEFDYHYQEMIHH
ncbi:hypothetical protein ACW186_09125 [Limosilactobacillus fermentum]